MRIICVLRNLFLPVLLMVFTGSPAAAGIPEQISWQRSFDEQDRLSKLVDPAGRETGFAYSTGPNGSLVVTKTPPEGSKVVWKSDDLGRRRSMTDSAGAVTYGYDDHNRVNRVQRKGLPCLAYIYDTLDRVISLRVGDFYELDYAYDFLGRLKSMKTPAGTITYEYLTGQGLLVRTLPNGIETIWKFEPNGQLRKITHANARRVILAEYTYEYRPDGLIAAIGERSSRGEFATAYKYDKVGRLIRAADQSGREYCYEYDQMGNRLRATLPGRPSQVCAYDWAGRLIKLHDKPCTHDAAGNLTSMTIDERKMKYRHNPDGQLVEANGKVSYRYDGEGRLIERKDGEVKTTLIPDPFSEYWQPLVMESSAGDRTLLVWNGSTPLIMIRKGKPEYMLHDHLGSVRLVVDDQGKVMQRVDYDPYGVMQDTETTTDFAPRFAGLFWDAAAQAYLTLARAYSSQLGCFLGPDPQKRLPFGAHKQFANYVYCGGDPINFFDINGLEPEHFEMSATRETAIVPSGSVWWSAFWNDVSRHSFDPHRAKDTLAIYSASHIRNARGSGVAAGLTATLLDVIGGYIPGEGGNRGQGYASVGWSLAVGGAVGMTRTVSSAAINVSQGDVKGALCDAISLGGGVLGSRAKNIMSGAHSVPGGQLEFNFMAPNMMKTANRFKIESDVIKVWDYYRKVYKIWQVGMKDWSNKPSGSHTAASYARDDRSSFPFGGPIGGTSGGGGPFFQNLSPSTVGGVYLGGAGQALEGIGQVEGVALDANNNLILLSKTGEEIGLPPLRLDDVVTVFRSVYIHGEGPRVTINPAKDPEGSAMIIQHGKATESTYVGWILFQADRLMKGYSLGVDNITTENVTSAVPGYAEVLDTLYFGEDTPEKSRRGGHWERFWIVPAGAHRFAAARRDLTLFDVPLKVKTQEMKWEKGELVDDPRGKSSAGALKFIKWFTKQYDSIAQEQYLTPPSESGVKGPVPVFAELRRIALITALAEKLRDQGTTMPFWMRDYEVRPVPFKKTTPGLQVTRSNGKILSRVYGGVALSPESREIKQFAAASDLKQLPKPERRHGKEILKRPVHSHPGDRDISRAAQAPQALGGRRHLPRFAHARFQDPRASPLPDRGS